jgi:hypothetical protein
MKIPSVKIPTIPSIDLTKIDAQALLNRLPHVPTDRVIELAKDAAYTTVGFGVLTFQKTQVRRQEVMTDLQAKLPGAVEQAVTHATSALTNLRRLVSNRKPTTEQHS